MQLDAVIYAASAGRANKSRHPINDRRRREVEAENNLDHR
jgi:hypothetical protein